MTLPALLPSLLVLALTATPGSQPSNPCAARRAGTAAVAFLVSPPRRARDTVVSAAVCVLPAKTSAVKIGSYHGELYFDSSAVQVVRIEKPAGGMRVENSKLAGQVNFAGAEPSGFVPGALLHVTFRVRNQGAQARLRLKMLELNGTDGTNLMTQLVTSPSP